MILSRFSIRGKLNILLMLALAAVLLVATPFVVDQVGKAQSAGRTADTARNARELGALVGELQRERLVTAAYLATPNAGSEEMVRQQRHVDEAAANVRSALGAQMSDELASALVRLGSLQELRQSALRRGVSPDGVARTFHAVIGALVDALRLVPQRTGDAEGTRQLTALEALLRGNEFGALRGMALIATAVDPQTGSVLLDDASAQAPMFIERFVQQADVEHAGLVVKVDQGDAARRVDELASQVTDGRVPTSREAYVTDVFTGVEAQSGLRRSVQDQVTSQIADAATNRATDARRVAWTIGLSTALLFGLLATLAIALSRSIANPLRSLTTAATNVADLADRELVRVVDSEEVDGQVPQLASIDVTTKDELGELAAAFNRVQSTATELVERQAVSRRNVSLMFANVAQRTQNLVGRQLTLVDQLERNEQDAQVLASLWRLDHLSTRLRRTADNLLVVAGARDTARIAGPIALVTALRSALAEIEDYQRVELGEMPEIILDPALGPDLVLVFAELLENATSFSPPNSTVELKTRLLPDDRCIAAIVDHGIGMTPQQLAQENERLVERERLEITPTSVLGLFVVGRLARRHSLNVQLTATPGGGVTAEVTIPASLFSAVPVPEPIPGPAQQSIAPRSPSLLSIPELHIPAPSAPGGFAWFMHQASEQFVALPTGEVLPSGPGEPSEGHGGLQRRVAGAQLPGGGLLTMATSPGPRARHDADSVRIAMDGYESAVATAARQKVAEPPSMIPAQRTESTGLQQRIPGASLASGLRDQPPHHRPVETAGTTVHRDPDADRTAFDAFSTGLTRAMLEVDGRLPSPGPRHMPGRRDEDSTKGSDG
jgi:signal transduction histidine kinase